MQLNMQRNGFTLIETLLYTAIAATSMAVLTLMFISGLQARSMIAAQHRVVDAQHLVELTILSRLEEADGIVAPTSGNSTILSIGSPNAAENPVTFQRSGDALTMQLGSDAALPLTSDAVRITNFSVTRLAGSPPSLIITISYEASASTDVTVQHTSTLSYTLRYE